MTRIILVAMALILLGLPVSAELNLEDLAKFDVKGMKAAIAQDHKDHQKSLGAACALLRQRMLDEIRDDEAAVTGILLRLRDRMPRETREEIISLSRGTDRPSIQAQERMRQLIDGFIADAGNADLRAEAAQRGFELTGEESRYVPGSLRAVKTLALGDGEPAHMAVSYFIATPRSDSGPYTKFTFRMDERYRELNADFFMQYAIPRYCSGLGE